MILKKIIMWSHISHDWSLDIYAMQTLSKNKKIKIKFKNRRFKKLSMFKLQNQIDSNLWGNWVSNRSI